MTDAVFILPGIFNSVDIALLILVAATAFILSFFDSTVGMGYGTSIIAILLLLGFSPREAVPAILFTNAILGLIAGFSHHKYENVDFSRKSKDFRVMLALTGFGFIGVIIAILVAVKIPDQYLEAYIGVLVLYIGAKIIIKHRSKHKFSWNKIIFLGTVAAFNKGLSGGAYGPVVVGGQILSGVQSKKAIGIAALAEGLISIVGSIAYFSINDTYLNPLLIIALLAGGATAVPIAAFVVQKYHPHKIRRIIGIVAVALGAAILGHLF